MNEIMNINGVECYEKDGVAYLKLEAVARGLGFTEIKDDKEYVMWRRVDGHLANLGFGTSAERPDFIPENIFYRLAMKAKNEVAEAFQAKVADEIIPSIRKHGMYATPDTVEKMLADPDVMIQALTALKEEREARKLAEEKNARLTEKAEADAPKVLFADSVSASKQSILVGELAKLMRQNGASIGQNRLFEKLRNDGFLHRGGSQKNMPTQRAMDMGLFEIQERTIISPSGSNVTTFTPKITGKGQIYFINRYLRVRK